MPILVQHMTIPLFLVYQFLKRIIQCSILNLFKICCKVIVYCVFFKHVYGQAEALSVLCVITPAVFLCWVSGRRAICDLPLDRP